MILDSTVPTDQNVMSWSTSMGQGWQQFCDHLIEACRETDDCAIQGDVYKTINTLSNDLASGSIAVTATDGQTVPLPPIALWERVSMAIPKHDMLCRPLTSYKCWFIFTDVLTTAF